MNQLVDRQKLSTYRTLSTFEMLLCRAALPLFLHCRGLLRRAPSALTVLALSLPWLLALVLNESDEQVNTTAQFNRRPRLEEPVKAEIRAPTNLAFELLLSAGS